MIYSKHIKAAFDKLAAVVLLILLLPLFVLIYLVLMLTQGKPVFFQQMRSGRGMTHFKLYKFRTLINEANTGLGMKNRRFTKLGNLMRKTGMDELPQIYNILKGEMSFIGPRPMPVEYESKYNSEQLQRFALRPGITGWAQINGRNNMTWDRRFELDIWYINQLSFVLDIKIIVMTFLQLAIAFISPKSRQVEMEVFNGSHQL